MDIKLEGVGRRFNQDWIFKDFNYTFLGGQKYAILGANGAGKSTLLSVLLGSLTPSAGTVVYQQDGAEVMASEIYKHISFNAPYTDLIEEFTLQETIDFHFKFKNNHTMIDKEGVFELLNLNKFRDKPLKYFSSGMKQRTKLALTFCSDTAILLLDEPTSNLDQQGVEWYLSLVDRFTANRLFVVASNQHHEYYFCDNQVNIQDYK